MSCKKTVSKSAVKSLSICGICHKEISDEDCGYLTYGCELCPVWLHAKCIFCDACEDELKTIFKFNRAFDVKCDSCRQALKKNDSSNIKVTQQIHNELNKKLPQIVTEVVKAYQEACQENLVKDAPFKSFAEIMNEQESAIQLFKDKNNQSIDKIVETVSDIKQQLDKCPKEYQEDDINEINSRKKKIYYFLTYQNPQMNPLLINLQMTVPNLGKLYLINSPLQIKILSIFFVLVLKRMIKLDHSWCNATRKKPSGTLSKCQNT